MSAVRRPDKQTPCYCSNHSIVKKIVRDGQSGILMPFGVKKQKSTLAAYGSATNIFPRKKNNV